MFHVYFLIFLSVLVYNAPLIQGQDANGDLRLSGFGNGGRLEVYLSSQGQWVTVCDDGFDFYEGDIACRQLGYLYADRVGNVQEFREYSYDSSLPTFLGDIVCSISTTRIIDCGVNYNKICDHDKDVVLQCTNTVSPLRLVSTDGRTDNLSSGRLELFIDNVWGTVCDRSFSGTFTKTEADVACNQLGFPESNAYYRASQVGLSAASSSIPIWLSDITCTLPANNLRMCSHSGTGLTRSCSHSNDIILSCRGDGNLRLVSSSNNTSTALLPYGRLEVYLNEQWGTVCDNLFSVNDANVACRQLGYSGYVRYSRVGNLGYPSTSSGPTWLDNLRCTRSDMTLTECSHDGIGVESCSHSKDVGLKCLRSGTNVTSTTRTPPTLGNSSVGGSVGGGLLVAGGVGLCVFCIYFGRRRRVIGVIVAN